MNLRDLKYLVAVADHLHFGKAADAVFISQPTLSGQIKKLEERLQVTIFERTTRGVNITPIGEKIIAEARQTMAHAQNIENLAANQSGVLCGELRLGIIPTIAPYLVPHFLSQALADYPKLTLSLHEDKTETLYAMLDNFTIDAAIIATEIPPENIEEIELYRESFLLLCPTTHPLSNKSCIEAQDINPKDLLLLPEGHCLRDQTLELCKLSNEELSGQADLRDAGLQTVIELVRGGRGYTFLPKLATNNLNDQTGSVALKRFSPKPERVVRLIFRKSFPRKSCLKALAKLISSAPSLAKDLASKLQ
ncbi:MAG: LysR family transcriptional regulator [Robiginitomaculum sp.]|nr:LysR family transcriptional regulator [Robiginitomaculum sp.]